MAADGSRLRDRDVVVEQDNVLYTGRGFPLSRAPGQSSITGRVFHEFDSGPMPDRPTGSSAALLSIKVSLVTLQLSTLGENPVTFDYTVPGSWGWAGTATEATVPADHSWATATPGVLSPAAAADEPGRGRRLPGRQRMRPDRDHRGPAPTG